MRQPQPESKAKVKDYKHFQWTVQVEKDSQGITSNTPVKNNGDISERFSTARRETETMLNTCLPKSKVKEKNQMKLIH